MNKLFPFAFSLLFVFACKNDTAPIQKLPEMTPNTGALGFETKKLARSESGCSIKADYVLASGGTAIVRNAINSEVLSALVSAMSANHSIGTARYESIEACADAFIADYKAQKTDPKKSGTWASGIQIRVLYEDDRRVSLRQKISQNIADQSFQELRFLSFDKNTGALLSASDLFSNLDAVHNLVTTAFEKKHGKEAMAKFFDLPDGQVPVLNIGMDKSTYYFAFNGADTEGTANFEVPVPADYLKAYLK